MLHPLIIDMNQYLKKENLFQRLLNEIILFFESITLPVVMNLNPRSIYNKTEDLFYQYETDIICISESWERDKFSLDELLQLDSFKVVKVVLIHK